MRALRFRRLYLLYIKTRSASGLSSSVRFWSEPLVLFDIRRHRRLAIVLAVLTASTIVSACGLFDFLQPHHAPEATVLWHTSGRGAPGPPAFDGSTAYFLTS